MGIASEQTHPTPVPNEPDQWIEFREIGYGDLRAARTARSRQATVELNDMNPKLYEVITRPRNETGPRVIVDPINQHDVLTLLDRGVVGWSYPIALPQPSSDPSQRDARRNVLGKLHESTAIWAARQIMDLAGVENAWGEQEGVIDVESEDVTHALPEGHGDYSLDSTDTLTLR